INSSSVTIYNADRLFVSKPLQLRKECVDFTRVNKLDFNDPRTAADEINGWVNSKTGGLIPAILDQAHINPKTELLLTSALYFKGTWLNEFDRKKTHGECFYRNGVCKTVAMMNLEAELNYAHVDDLRAHALELPYQNKRYSMMILMPQDRDAGLALIRHLPDFRLRHISNMLQPTHVVLTMPKFTVEYGADMVAPLKNTIVKLCVMIVTALMHNLLARWLGNRLPRNVWRVQFPHGTTLCVIYKLLFRIQIGACSTFILPALQTLPLLSMCKLIDGAEAHLNTIFDKVYMSVDEKGTIAAAATADMLVPLMDNFVPLLVNRPFIFFIWDNEKGVVLFEGKIEEPTEFDAVTNNKFGQPENQPSQPTNQPIPPTNQPMQPTSQPSQPTNQPSQPTNQTSRPTNQRSQPTNQPSQPTSQPSQLTDEPIEPTNQISRPTNQRSQPTNQPIEPTNQPSQPTSDPSQSTSQPITEYSTRPYYDALPIGWFRKVSVLIFASIQSLDCHKSLSEIIAHYNQWLEAPRHPHLPPDAGAYRFSTRLKEPSDHHRWGPVGLMPDPELRTT
ncbi:hypothetical protein SFRURICE_016302, partial [Spodoptera frugiperda]